jgi:hypothetical protein
MSNPILVDRDVLVAHLLDVRRAADEALRVLGQVGTPPPPIPSAQPAELVLGSKPPSHEHTWQASGFGSMGKTCSVCGAKG